MLVCNIIAFLLGVQYLLYQNFPVPLDISLTLLCQILDFQIVVDLYQLSVVLVDFLCHGRHRFKLLLQFLLVLFEVSLVVHLFLLGIIELLH